MTTSLPLDQELEIFGWPEIHNTSDSMISYNSIVDHTIIIAIFLTIYIYCCIEFFFELIINDHKINIFLPQISFFNLREFFVFPMLTAK